jgi:hypothetical protein
VSAVIEARNRAVSEQIAAAPEAVGAADVSVVAWAVGAPGVGAPGVGDEEAAQAATASDKKSTGART